MLFKCLYGILMLLPQSSAFATLRNRLNSVNHLTNVTANIKTNRKQDGQSQEMLSHFITVQNRHLKGKKVGAKTPFPELTLASDTLSTSGSSGFLRSPAQTQALRESRRPKSNATRSSPRSSKASTSMKGKPKTVETAMSSFPKPTVSSGQSLSTALLSALTSSNQPPSDDKE
jgi:hypothetical protein